MDTNMPCSMCDTTEITRPGAACRLEQHQNWCAPPCSLLAFTVLSLNGFPRRLENSENTSFLL